MLIWSFHLIPSSCTCRDILTVHTCSCTQRSWTRPASLLNVHACVSGDAPSRGTREMGEQVICSDVWENEHTVVGSNTTLEFHWGSYLWAHLTPVSATMARHAKWIQHKCLLLFNFYVTSIKHHKPPLHLDDTVLKPFIHGFEDEVDLATKTETHR